MEQEEINPQRQDGAMACIVLNPTRIRSFYSTQMTWGDLKFLRRKKVKHHISHEIPPGSRSHYNALANFSLVKIISEFYFHHWVLLPDWPRNDHR